MRSGRVRESHWVEAKIVLEYHGYETVTPTELAEIIDTTPQRAALMLKGIGWTRVCLNHGFTEYHKNDADICFIGRSKYRGAALAADTLDISKEEALEYV